MFDEFIHDASQTYNVPSSWIQAVIETESGWNPNASNPNDPSYGLMGLMLATAKDMGYSGGVAGLYDPETNIHIGTKYIRWIMDRWNTADFREMYSAYNSGSPTLWERSTEVAAHVETAMANLSKYTVAGSAALLLGAGILLLWRKKK